MTEPIYISGDVSKDTESTCVLFVGDKAVGDKVSRIIIFYQPEYGQTGRDEI